MAEYIDREKFLADKRKQYCGDCDKRKGIKRGKTVFCYEIGDAPCRSCGIGDILDDVEDFPAADVVEVVRCRECKWFSDGKWCRNPNNDMVQGGTTGEWFCGDGKRKEQKDEID